jgi:hypothetical protein
MKITPDRIARILEVAAETATLTSIDCVLSVYSHDGKTRVHMTTDEFLDTFDSYKRRTFTDEFDEIYVTMNNVEFFALVDRYE